MTWFNAKWVSKTFYQKKKKRVRKSCYNEIWAPTYVFDLMKYEFASVVSKPSKLFKDIFSKLVSMTWLNEKWVSKICY